MPVPWDQLIIRPDEADLMAAMQWWSWLLLKPYRPAMMTAFGDWILVDPQAKHYLLDLQDGSLTQVAKSREELHVILQMPEVLQRWFLPDLVEKLQQSGNARPRGGTYAYRVHPLMGGPIAMENIMLLEIPVWQAICGQLHQQARQLPPGKRVAGIDHVEGLKIKIIVK